MSLAPVSLFVYNRIEHTKRTIEALKKNHLSENTELYLFSDGSKKLEDNEKIDELRLFIKTITGFKKVFIVEREINFGLAKSIISGVTEVLNKYDKIIVLEDDMIVSSYFLKYMNTGLDIYQNETDVISIHGYVYPVKKKLPETFFLKGADCWGWATWKRGWDLFETDGKILMNEIIEKKLIYKFNFNGSFPYFEMLQGQVSGENNSWAIRWYASAFLKNKLTLYPGSTLVKNIGNDGSGTNCPQQDNYDVTLCDRNINVEKIETIDNKSAFKFFKQYFIKNFNYNKSIIQRLMSKIFSIIGLMW